MQQKELERLRNSIFVLGQELADQQQRLDKGIQSMNIVTCITCMHTFVDQQDLILLQDEVKERGMNWL